MTSFVRLPLRRIHMFLGLFMYPWVVFFGVSGALFNHANLGEDSRVSPLPPARLEALSGIRPLPAREAAARIASSLADRGYRLDEEYAPRYEGSAILQGDAPARRVLLFVDVEKGKAALVERKAMPRADNPLRDVPVAIPELTLAHIEARAKDVGKTLGVMDGPLMGRPAIAPELRFRLVSPDGARFNATYDVASGVLDGRPTSSLPELGVKGWMSRLHKRHHYGDGLGKGIFWPLFQDLGGVTMVLWAVTGLVMTWQMAKWRAVGAAVAGVALVVALAVGAVVMDDVRFGNIHRGEGPGED